MNTITTHDNKTINADYEAIQAAATWIKEKTILNPKIGLVLGSGLSEFASKLNNATSIHFSDIPGFPVSTVSGHKGELVLGTIEGISVAVMSGRVHYYEGYDPSKVVFPIRVLKLLGVDNLLVTNSAGSTNPSYNPGDLMCIGDQINFTGTNPLMGTNENKFGPRFPDMSEPYKKWFSDIIVEKAQGMELTIHRGTYIGVSGPSYETPAEIKLFHTFGADAVGMSTVYEVIAANHCGMNVGGLSLITNLGSGLSDEPLRHEDVKKAADAAKEGMVELLKKIIVATHTK